jgi:hypothetical protein
VLGVNVALSQFEDTTMASWVRCIAYEEGVDPSFSPQPFINLDTVRFMVRGVESTRVLFVGGNDETAVSVRETPEQLLGVAPK